MTAITVDPDELTTKVQRMYRAVATEPHGNYHLELGRSLAERLGYPDELLDRIADGALESFAGVGCFLDLADLRAGESVLDLGQGRHVRRGGARPTTGRTARARGHRQRAAIEGLDRLRRRPVGVVHRRRPQEDDYRQAIEAAGLCVQDIRRNPYEFISGRARNASAKYGVKSVSLLARKER